MRVMLKVAVDTEAGNQAVQDGSLQRVIEQLMSRTKPEAAYFGLDNGRRAVFMFFDMTDSADMPWIGEEAFQVLNAEISASPVMNLEDLQRGLAKLS